jgi:hypothetical protein
MLALFDRVGGDTGYMVQILSVWMLQQLPQPSMTLGVCAQVRLFADVYESDIVVASPLGITTRLEEHKDDGCDFLASIEIAVVFRADVMLMQNWSHLASVFESLNQMPQQQHGTDIMRVRCADFPQQSHGCYLK